jgi:hypothetical protein
MPVPPVVGLLPLPQPLCSHPMAQKNVIVPMTTPILNPPL